MNEFNALSAQAEGPSAAVWLVLGVWIIGVASMIGCAIVPVEMPELEESQSLLFRPTHTPYRSRDVKFSHDLHSFLECVDCHEETSDGESTARGSTPDIRMPSMARCFECHDGSTATASCQACHLQNAFGRKPSFHTGAWPTQHRRMAEDEAYKCALCHRQSECQSCHATRKPLSHTPRFQKSTHGRLATSDRSSCATCHRSSFCENCHSQAPPDHTALFRGVILPDGTVRAGHKQAALLRGRSCLTCHSFEEACSQCHG